jgi:hypothetical protein
MHFINGFEQGTTLFERTRELLGTWSHRAAFRAVKNPATPREWEIGSYEGARFTIQEDGSWVSHWMDPRQHGLPDRAKS